jgi:hypothetical protein
LIVYPFKPTPPIISITIILSSVFTIETHFVIRMDMRVKVNLSIISGKSPGLNYKYKYRYTSQNFLSVKCQTFSKQMVLLAIKVTEIDGIKLDNASFICEAKNM